MTLHALRQYLVYRLKAQARHGIHSPFVYGISDYLLKSNNKRSNNAVAVSAILPSVYGRVLGQIAAHLEYKSIIEDVQIASAADAVWDIILFTDGKASQWYSSLQKYLPLLSEDGMIVVPDIHATRAHTQQWNELKARLEVKLSIDMYGIGLLFFKHSFKEQQHFILSY